MAGQQSSEGVRREGSPKRETEREGDKALEGRGRKGSQGSSERGEEERGHLGQCFLMAIPDSFCPSDVFPCQEEL